MSLVTSRRSLILGATSLVAFPMIARASSLMHVRGELMDKWMVVYPTDMGNGTVLYSTSQFDPSQKDPSFGVGLYARGINYEFWSEEKILLLSSMSTDPRLRVRQLNLIRPYHSIQYEAKTKSEVDALNAAYRAAHGPQ